MVRRKRSTVRFPRKQIPKIFSCPKCGLTAVRVVMEKKKNTATVICGKCHLTDEFPLAPVNQAIDIYCKFTDKFNVGELA
jgi:transcription elongation factor Elf1